MDMNEEYGLTPYETREILFYKTDNGEVRVEILLYQENLWLTQAKMAELFEVQKAAISKHLKNIFTCLSNALIILDNIEMIVEYVTINIFNIEVFNIIKTLLNNVYCPVVITTSYYDVLSRMTLLDSVEYVTDI